MDDKSSCDSAEPNHLFNAELDIQIPEGMYANKRNLELGKNKKAKKINRKTKYTKLSNYDYKKLTSSEDENDYFPHLL